MITWRAFIGSPPPAPRGAPARRAARARPRSTTSARGADHVGRRPRRRRRARRRRRCCGRTWRRSPRSSAEHHQHAACAVEVGRAPRRPAWSRARRTPRVDDRERAAVGVHGQRRAQRAAARLAVDLDGVARAAWGRRPRRRRCGAARTARRRGHGRCPSGARPWRRSSRPRRGSWSRRCRGGARASSARTASWTSGPWKRSPKTALVEVDLARASCRCTAPGARPSGVRPDLDHAALRARARRRGRAAGSASASTSTTSRPRWVTRLLPIWPGPRMPLNTRAGWRRRRSSPARGRCGSRGRPARGGSCGA